MPEKRLHARQATLFAATANRVAEAFLKTPREKQLLHFLLLPRVLGLGLEKGQLAATLKAFPTIIPTLRNSSREKNSPSPDPIKQASRLLEKGYLGRAAKALYDTAPLAPNNAKTLAILREKHPIGPKNPFKGKTRPAAGSPVTLDAIIGAITSINREKAPGLSGWSRPLLDLVTTKESPVIALLRLLADMIRQGTAPGGSLLCAARLIGLEKPDGGIRPIAIGDLIYRVATKAILTTLYRPEMLLPSQLGVNSPGGVEPAVFLLSDAIIGKNPYKITKVTSVDLKNAFNASSRAIIAGAIAKFAPTLYKTATWAYNEPSVLVTPTGETLASSEGIRQGDPLGPLFFSLGFRPTLEEIQRRLPKVILVAYLDDLYALDPDEKNPTLGKISQVFKGSTLSLNLNKSKEYSIKTLRKTGLLALGTAIGPIPFRRAFLQQRLETLGGILSTLKKMSKQYAYLLLKGSISLLIRHLLRQLSPIGLEDLWAKADDLIRASTGHLTQRRHGDPIPALNDDLISLPLREGGLGLTLYTDHNGNLPNATYTAAYAAARPLMEAIGSSRAPRARQSSPNATTPTAKQALKDAVEIRIQRFQATQPAELQRLRTENSSFLGRQWLTALPTRRQLQWPDAEVTEAYRARLGIPVRTLNLPCTFCGQVTALDHQDVCRGASRRWTSRHDQITRAFTKTLACRATLQVEEEPQISQDATLRADFAITTENSRYYYDVQVVAIGKESARTDPYSTLTEAADAKRRKYRSLGPYFRPLIFSAGGLMEKETAKSYKALQALLGPTGSDFLSTTIALILAKSRAFSALSIAKESPYNDELAWQTTRAALRHQRALTAAN
ncbi:MAG: reverse transcriptase domain-containing protein [Methanophagales archaeon]|nr:reverse transcriptase domain-containing protein [Methanophagales archaeon]